MNKKDVVAAEAVNTAPAVSESKTVKAKPVQKVVKAAYEPKMNDLIPVISCVRKGQLIYASSRMNGYTVVWHNYLEEQRIELSELVAMKGTNIRFFEQGWIAIPDSYEHKDEVLAFLGVSHFYNDKLDPSVMDALFIKPIDEMVSVINDMTESKKKLVIEAAKNAIADDVLDSLKRIRALEEALDCKLS